MNVQPNDLVTYIQHGSLGIKGEPKKNLENQEFLKNKIIL